MKGKIQAFVGLVLIALVAFGIVKGIYTRNFVEPEVEIIESMDDLSVVKNALFWYEEELEKTSTGRIGSRLSSEGSSFTKSVYNSLEKTGMVNDYITTMSEAATKRMIELNAYRGTEPNVWQIAKQNEYPYIFKVVILNMNYREKSGDLVDVEYQFSLYDTFNNSLVWQAKSTRLSGFFGGMPENSEMVSILKNKLKQSKIIE